jgi:hypothetical protein
VILSGLTESLSPRRRALAAALLFKPLHIDQMLGALLEICPN